MSPIKNDYVVELREYFHENPEESFLEFNTSKRIADELVKLSLKPIKIAETGVYADIKGNKDGRTVAFRADIDALPVEEKNNVPYKSKNKGIMHACGHDAHTAMALGIAKYFSENRNFKGTVRVFFQPAEEAPPGGAIKMIKEGLMDGVEYVIGQHVTSELPAGSLGFRPGAANANSDSFFIKILGKGGHGSAPHKSVDAIFLAAEYISLIQGIISRKTDPVKPAVITVGTINGGYRHNVIADEVKITGTVRTQDDETQQMIRGELENLLKGLCEIYHATYDFKYEVGYPVMINDEVITNIVKDVSSSIVGEENVFQMPQRMGGEDFGYYLRKSKGSFYYLGVANENKGIVSPNHSPTFDIDESALSVGVNIGVRIIKKLLEM